jgi:hypothetical protein
VSIAPTRERQLSRRTATDNDGRFTLEALTDGTYEIRAAASERYAPETQSVTISGGSAPDIEMRLASAQPTVFVVTDAQSGARLEPMINVTDGKKQVAFARGNEVYVAAGHYRAFVNARGYVAQQVEFTAPGPEIRVALQIAGRLELFAARPTRARIASTGQVAMATPTGTVLEIAPGSYSIEVLSADRKSVLKSVPAVVNAGQTTAVTLE